MYDLISEAHEKGAELVVLPELICVELLSLAPDLEEKDVAKFLVQFSKEIEDWIARISHSSGMMLVGGSYFKEIDGGIAHAGIVATPDRKTTITQKVSLSAYERNMWRLTPGEGLRAVPESAVGVILSSDSRHQGAWRGLVSSGVQVVCVPSCSETSDDFFDIRLACSENASAFSVFALHASLVGRLGYQPVVSSYGSSAIIAPDGSVLDETAPNEEGVAVADIDLESIDRLPSGHEPEMSEEDSWKIV